MKSIFGFSAVQAGQKSNTVNAEPRIVANSTIGKFMATSAVSKALNVAVGENIMFINNISEVEIAVANNHEAIVAWANENGVDLTTREGQDAAVKAFTVWAIAKGVPQYNAKGEPMMGSVRYTKEDKIDAILSKLDEFLGNDDILAAIANAMGTESVDPEQFVAILKSDDKEDEYINKVKDTAVSFVTSPEYHTSTGSKTATTGSSTGVGCQLNFTDTAIWSALKKDLGDNMDKKNRNYRVLLDESFEVDVNDGCKAVKVTAFPIEYIDDTDPIIREKKN